MTSVVVWRERAVIDGARWRKLWGNEPREPDAVSWKHVGDVWIAADSRISSATNTGSRLVPTDAALKILPVDLHLFREYEDGPGSLPTYNAQIAFAYAGSVLPATMTYAMITSYFRGLTGSFDQQLPSIGSLVAFINRVGSTYSAETMQRFEAFVVGCCPLHQANRRAHTYKLCFDASGQPRSPQVVDLEPDGSFALLGSNIEAIGAIISEGMQRELEYNPALAIKSIIEEQIAGDIGGYLHLARVSTGVEIYPAWRGDKGHLPSPYADKKLGGIAGWHVNGIFGVR